jgi:hypothetical protein
MRRTWRETQVQQPKYRLGAFARPALVVESDIVEGDLPAHLARRYNTISSECVNLRDAFDNFVNAWRGAAGDAERREGRRGLSEAHRAHERAEEGDEQVLRVDVASRLSLAPYQKHREYVQKSRNTVIPMPIPLTKPLRTLDL